MSSGSSSGGVKVVVKDVRHRPTTAKANKSVGASSGGAAKGNGSGLPKDTVMAGYELMLKIRRFEERAATLYQQGQIGGFCHLYIGQEAVVAGCKAATGAEDDYITSYRCHAHALACGVSAEAVMSELTGRSAGVSKGKGGSMHMFDPAKKFWGGHGIVGAQVPLGAGLAFAAKYKNTGGVSLTFLGDGASNEGAFFEALNLAALWKLPVIFIIENNVYGMGTSVTRSSAGELYKRGEAFGIRGEKVDGMDFFAVQSAIERIAKEVRENSFPVLVEMNTYRYRGHSMSDPAKYRTREEVEEKKDNHDPINNVKKVLIEKYGVSEKDLAEMDKAVKAEMVEVAKFATSAPIPDESEVMTDVMAEGK